MSETLPPEHPFDSLVARIARNREQKMKLAKQFDVESAVCEIQVMLKDFSRCCIPNSFRWPEEKTLDRLHSLVARLYDTLGRVRWTTAWEKYRVVNRKWSKLHLVGSIEKLVKRASHQTPPRPFGAIAVMAYGRSGKTKELAQEALKVFRRLRKDETLHETRWGDFEPLRKLLPDLRVKQTGSPDLVMYTRFVQAVVSDFAWLNDYSEGLLTLDHWLKMDLQCSELRDILSEKASWLALIGEVDDLSAGERKEHRRLMDKERKRRRRARDQKTKVG